jgi:hypothetical protein
MPAKRVLDHLTKYYHPLLQNLLFHLKILCKTTIFMKTYIYTFKLFVASQQPMICSNGGLTAYIFTGLKIIIRSSHFLCPFSIIHEWIDWKQEMMY